MEIGDFVTVRIGTLNYNGILAEIDMFSTKPFIVRVAGMDAIHCMWDTKGDDLYDTRTGIKL